MKESPETTRARLLAAAGPVFASRGFRSTTVRDVCAKAGANIAAVSYHFGDKLGLYRAVLEDVQGRVHRRHAPAIDPGLDAQARLRAWIEAFVRRVLDDDRPEWQTRLMLREVLDPTPALDDVIRHYVRPQWETLTGIVRELLGEGATQDRVERCGSSIVGQCLMYRNCAPMIRALHTSDRYTPGAIRDLAEHIADFSIPALRAMASAGKHGTAGKERRP